MCIGDICRKSDQSSSNSTCKNIKDCPVIIKQMKEKNYSTEICSFAGRSPIVCCPPTPEPMETYSASESK